MSYAQLMERLRLKEFLDYMGVASLEELEKMKEEERRDAEEWDKLSDEEKKRMLQEVIDNPESEPIPQ